MKKIIFILLVASVLFGGYYYLNHYTTLLSSARSFQNPNSSILDSQTCKISLMYPKEWIGKITDGPYGCVFSIENPQDETNFLLLNNVTGTTWEEIIAQQEQSEAIVIDGIQGIKSETELQEGLFMGGVYFQKGNVIYSLAYGYKENDPESKQILEDIIASISFTGTDEDFNEPIKDGVEEAQNQTNDLIIKKDFEILEHSLIQYYNQYKAYPSTLSSLQQAGYIGQIPEHPMPSRSYQYTSTGQSFTLSATKSDGTSLTISR